MNACALHVLLAKICKQDGDHGIAHIISVLCKLHGTQCSLQGMFGFVMQPRFFGLCPKSLGAVHIQSIHSLALFH